jgi:hypothetical protein
MTLQLRAAVPIVDVIAMLGRPPRPERAPPQQDAVLVSPGLFAPEELGWLAEEARGSAGRLSGRPRVQAAASAREEGPAGTLYDIDVHDEPFRRLLAHPRLLARVRALLPEPFGVRRTRLVGEHLSADGIWRREPDLTAVVSLHGGTEPALLVRSGGALDGELAVPLPTGSVAFLNAGASYALRRRQSRSGVLILISYAALADRVRPLEASHGDDCLWPPAFACAG